METTYISQPIPRGVSRLFTVAVIIYYISGAILFLQFILLLSGKSPGVLVLSSSIVGIGITFMQGYGLVSRKKWLIPFLFINLGFSIVLSSWLFFESSSLIYSLISIPVFRYIFFGIGLFGFLALIYAFFLAFLSYKYRSHFSGPYFHWVFSSILIVVLVFGAVSSLVSFSTIGSQLEAMKTIASGSGLALTSEVSFNVPHGWSIATSTPQVILVESADKQAVFIIMKDVPLQPSATMDSLFQAASVQGIQASRVSIGNGIDAISFSSSKDPSVFSLSYMIIHNGWAYQITETASATSSDSFKSDFDQLLSGISFNS